MRLNVVDPVLVNDKSEGGVQDKSVKIKFMINDLSKPNFLKKCEMRVQKTTNPSTIYDHNDFSKRNEQPLLKPKYQTLYNQRIIHRNLTHKYLSIRDSYNTKIINDMLSNEATHLVASFKEYLIYDDIDEFIKRFYFRKEAERRIKYQTVCHNKYSKVFPNYFVLEEKKYMFKSIRKKQKVIDRMNNSLDSLSVEQSILLTKNFMREIDKTDSVLGKTLRRLKNELESNTLMLSYTKSKEQNKDSINLQGLVDEFVLKDISSVNNNKKQKALRSKSKDFLKLNISKKKPKTNIKKKIVITSRAKSIGKLIANTPTQPKKLKRVQTVLAIKNESVNNKRNSLSARGHLNKISKLKGKIMKDQYFSSNIVSPSKFKV